MSHHLLGRSQSHFLHRILKRTLPNHSKGLHQPTGHQRVHHSHSHLRGMSSLPAFRIGAWRVSDSALLALLATLARTLHPSEQVSSSTKTHLYGRLELARYRAPQPY